MVADDIVFRFDVRPAQEDHAKYQRRPERGQTLDTGPLRGVLCEGSIFCEGFSAKDPLRGTIGSPTSCVKVQGHRYQGYCVFLTCLPSLGEDIWGRNDVWLRF